MNLFNRFSDNRGMTLAEVLVVTAIGTGLLLTITKVNLLMNQSINQQVQTIQTSAGNQQGTQLLRQDIENALPSLNALVFPDDSNLGFFDYDPDFDCTNPAVNCTRTLTLSADQSEIDLILAVGPRLTYDPAMAYNTTGALPQYQGLNYNSALTSAGISPVYSSLWASGNLLILICPQTFMAPIPTPPALPVPSRSIYFLGQVAPAPGSLGNSNLIYSSVTTSPTQRIGKATFQMTHPLKSTMNSAILINTPITNSPDNYFRYLPPMGGADAYSFIQQVSIVRYQIRTGYQTPPYSGQGPLPTPQPIKQLYRTTWVNGKFDGSTDLLIDQQFTELIFNRTSINAPVISYNLMN